MYLSENTNMNTPGVSNTNTRVTLTPLPALFWTDLEPWIDTEYVRQVCALMRWDAGILAPAPSSSSYNTAANGGATPINPGYAVLTFGSADAAARALGQAHFGLRCPTSEGALRPPLSYLGLPRTTCDYFGLRT
ncbi:hypothetical protein B0H13DRAFT_2319492 [Mycena leptocephala]|nr:hypothetical protein B0H13DRAFT_2319492 [Mycena leptocephala]